MLAPIPEGWDATLEHRGQGWRYRLFGVDHWAVVARSETGTELLFDYWGDRTPGENPDIWFRDVFNIPLDNRNMFTPQKVLPDGPISPGFGPEDAQQYMDLFWPKP